MTQEETFTFEELEELYEQAGFGEEIVGVKDYFTDAYHVLAYALAHTLEAYLKLKATLDRQVAAGKIDRQTQEAVLKAFTNCRQDCLEAALYLYADNYQEWYKRAHNGIDRENAYEVNCWICVACTRVGEELFSGVWDKQAFKRALAPYRK